MCDSKNCDSQSNDSGFIMGIVVGAVIGAAVAVYVYKNNKTDVFADLKLKLESYFKQFTQPEAPARKPKPIKSKLIARAAPSKIPVVIPKAVESIELKPAKKPQAKEKMFVKPKK
jgi:hypothetical protein